MNILAAVVGMVVTFIGVYSLCFPKHSEKTFKSWEKIYNKIKGGRV